MAGVFDLDIAAAKELIDLYGMDCAWQKPTPEDAGEPGYPVAGVQPAAIPCRMAFFTGRDLNRGAAAFLAMMQGTDVSMSDEIGLLAGGLSFTPELVDTVVRDGVTLAIKEIDRVAPNGTPILYYVTVAS